LFNILREFGVLGTSSSPRQFGFLWYCLPLAMLGFAQWLAYRERYGLASFLMLLGGLGTVPIGFFAIIGSMRANRMRFQTPVKDGPEAHCLRCGYDLRGAPGPRCPECGYVIAKWDAPPARTQE
ncbi:MAG: hypothetical protein GXP29_04370, partial [Planctomycetes bacterium]|nr:hypothetical protein [Planctomycetota bacterium]